jgi:NAD(P)-dependent dehydrogenase (short-subunit alcohol dehydrogenase family)
MKNPEEIIMSSLPVAVVTGGTSGIGLAVVHNLA